MFVLVILDTLELNVTLSVVLERNQMMYPFVLQKENVFLQTNVNVMLDQLELNVIYQDVD
jgi:hypothetical protein